MLAPGEVVRYFSSRLEYCGGLEESGIVGTCERCEQPVHEEQSYVRTLLTRTISWKRERRGLRDGELGQALDENLGHIEVVRDAQSDDQDDDIMPGEFDIL